MYQVQHLNMGILTMLRIGVLPLLLVFLDSACAQSQEDAECLYAGRIVQELNDPAGGKVVSGIKSVDRHGEETTYTYLIEFDNRDNASVEQKYCSMYNLSVTYRIKKLDKENFENALSAIDEIVKGVKQDYRLKAPLNAIVDMAMNQNRLSLDFAFDIGLPPQAVNSREYVEHSISFKPLFEPDVYEAEVEFYFGLGGE